MSVTGFIVDGQIQKYDYNSLDNLPDDTGAGSFPVIYNVTTTSEITQALNKNQIPILKDPTTGSLYYLNSSAELNGDRIYIFVSNQGDRMRQVEVVGNTWGSFSDTILALNTSPTFQGVPKAPTAPTGTNNTQLATTAFVQQEIMYGALSEDLKQALLQIASKIAYIDEYGQTYYNDLYNALYPHELMSISATFNQGSNIIYDIDPLTVLNQYLTVVANYSDGTTETISSSNYTLSGNLLEGVSTITVYYEGFTDTFDVNVTHMAGYYTIVNNLTGCTTNNSATAIQENTSYTATITASAGYTLSGATATITMGGNILTGVFSNGTISIPNVTGDLVITVVASAITVSSITAVYTQSGTVYDTDTVDSLKADLVVTAYYSDSSTQTVPAADYTLSGTLETGTSTITVSYGGKTTTFSVTITDSAQKPVPSGYTAYDYVVNDRIGGSSTTNNGICIDTGLLASIYATVDHEIDFQFSASGFSTTEATYTSSAYGARAGTGAANIPNAFTFFLRKQPADKIPTSVPAFAQQYNAAEVPWTEITENAIHRVVTGHKSVYLDGNLVADNVEGEETYAPANITLAIFGEHRDNFYAVKEFLKVRHFIVRDEDGKAIAAMYPAKNGNGVSGLYDVIRGGFFTAKTPAWLACGND